jgi:hypothetical protein
MFMDTERAKMAKKKEPVSLPLIQIDDEVREMTPEEYALYVEETPKEGQQ